jgi:hypothetical protein
VSDDTYSDARGAAKGRVKHYLGDDPDKPVDASGYRPPGPELGMVATGERPVSRARYRAGGSVTGAKTTMRVDRKPRAAGGMTASQYINRDVKEANESRAGLKHDGGFASGGKVMTDGRASRMRAHKFMGGPMMGNASPYVSQMQGASGGALSQAPPQRAVMPGQSMVRPFAGGGRIARKSGGKIHADAAEDKALIKSEMHKAGCTCAKCHGGKVGKAGGGALDGTLQGMRPKGGRLARKSGGKAKGAMNVNIIIAPPKPQAAMPPPGMAGPPKGIPAPPPAAMGPPAGAPPPMGPPAAGAPPMMRKSGGRAYPLTDGSGGGKGRLEKIKAYG